MRNTFLKEGFKLFPPAKLYLGTCILLHTLTVPIWFFLSSNCRHTRPDFYLLSSRNRADPLWYESKPTHKREQYDLRLRKIWTGSLQKSCKGQFGRFPSICVPSKSPTSFVVPERVPEVGLRVVVRNYYSL